MVDFSNDLIFRKCKRCEIIYYLFIFLLLFTQDSLFSSVELLSMRVLPSLRNTYKGALQNYQWIAIFTTEGLTEGLNSESFDTKLNALTVRPRIHSEIGILNNIKLTSLPFSESSYTYTTVWLMVLCPSPWREFYALIVVTPCLSGGWILTSLKAGGKSWRRT